MESRLELGSDCLRGYSPSRVGKQTVLAPRHYDPQQGRFTQVDPIGMRSVSLTSPQTLNLYAYCGNDPINHLDPSGLFWGKLFKWISKALKWIGIAVLVAVVVMSGPFAPASGTVLAHILGFLIHLGAIIGSAINFVAGGVLLAEGATAASAAILGASGLLLASSGVGAVANQQRKQQKEKDGRPPKVPNLIIVVEKSPVSKYKLCVSQRWEIFNQEVEKIKKAAEERTSWTDFFLTLGDLLIRQGQRQPSEPGEKLPENPREPIDPTIGPQIASAMQRQKEIEAATQKAADDLTQSRVQLVELLIAKGAAVNHRDGDGSTALMYAARNGDTQLVNALLRNGAPVNLADKEGETALMKAAASSCNEETVRRY